MIYNTMLKEHRKELYTLSTYLQKLGFESELFDDPEILPIPVLSFAIKTEENFVYTTNALFAPLPKNELEHSRFLQFSTDINVSITKENKEVIYDLMNCINGFVPLGHLAILDNILYFRYTYSIAEEESIIGNSLVETLSMHVLFCISYIVVFKNLSTGTVTLEDAIKEVQSMCQ